MAFVQLYRTEYPLSLLDYRAQLWCWNGPISGLNMDLAARKPVFRVSHKARLKPVSSATETSEKVEISLEASLDMMLSNEWITKALTRLRVCAGWSALLLFATLRRQVFSHRGPYDKQCEKVYFQARGKLNYFMLSSEFNAYQMCIKLIFSSVK